MKIHNTNNEEPMDNKVHTSNLSVDHESSNDRPPMLMKSIKGSHNNDLDFEWEDCSEDEDMVNSTIMPPEITTPHHSPRQLAPNSQGSSKTMVSDGQTNLNLDQGPSHGIYGVPDEGKEGDNDEDEDVEFESILKNLGVDPNYEWASLVKIIRLKDNKLHWLQNELEDAMANEQVHKEKQHTTMKLLEQKMKEVAEVKQDAAHTREELSMKLDRLQTELNGIMVKSTSREGDSPWKHPFIIGLLISECANILYIIL